MRLDNLNVSIIQLWYFTQVVEAGSYAGAARYLNVTQSTLSKSMLALEKTLELRLFERSGKSLRLTRAGEYLYRAWSELLRGMESALVQAQKLPGGLRRTLRVGVLESQRPELFLTEGLRRFGALWPDCEVEIERVGTAELRRKLLEQKLDSGFTVRYETEQADWPDCGLRIIRECPHLACMLPSNPLAERASAAVEELADMNLVLISALHLPTYSRMVHDLFAAAPRQPHTEFSTVNASSQVYHLRGPADFFICDRYHRDYGLDDLRYIPLRGSKSGIALVWDLRALTPELEGFLSLFPPVPDEEGLGANDK